MQSTTTKSNMPVKIKFAIIGCGRIAQRHAEHIAKFGELVAVCDVDKDKADILASKYSCKAIYDINDLLISDIALHVVSIC